MGVDVLPRSPVPYESALIVDDDQLMLDLIGHMLRQLGVREIRTASSGDAGKREFERAGWVPDIVVCDLYMPDTDGFQFMEFLGERRFRGGVLLVSGTDDRTRHSAAIMAEFHHLAVLGVLPKPFSRDAFLSALSTRKPA